MGNQCNRSIAAERGGRTRHHMIPHPHFLRSPLGSAKDLEHPVAR